MLDVSGIPEHAVRKETTGVVLSANDVSRFPWSGEELQYDGDRIFMFFAHTRIDITERYNAWMEAQPKTHTVSFEWTDPE